MGVHGGRGAGRGAALGGSTDLGTGVDCVAGTGLCAGIGARTGADGGRQGSLLEDGGNVAGIGCRATEPDAGVAWGATGVGLQVGCTPVVSRVGAVVSRGRFAGGVASTRRRGGESKSKTIGFDAEPGPRSLSRLVGVDGPPTEAAAACRALDRPTAGIGACANGNGPACDLSYSGSVWYAVYIPYGWTLAGLLTTGR